MKVLPWFWKFLRILVVLFSLGAMKKAVATEIKSGKAFLATVSHHVPA